MAPGPKKKSFHTPRNVKNTQNCKSSDKKHSESLQLNKTLDTSSNLTINSERIDNKKYSKRSIENNWVKYEEPPIDPHADSTRGKDFSVLLSYSGGSGSQVKMKDEKDWEDETLNMKDILLNFQDLVNSMKCIPFHERINLPTVFDNKLIKHFISSAEKWKTCYKSQSWDLESKHMESSSDDDIDLNIVEEEDSFEPDEFPSVKNFSIQDKTENIINALASNLTFQDFSKKEEKIEVEEKKPESASNDLDFLLSLNISSKISVKEENTEVPKTSNIDDWLDSILDD